MPSSRKLRAFDITFYYSTEEKKLRISRPNHRNCRRKSRKSPGSFRADCTSFSIKTCAIFSYFPRSMCFSRAFCCSGRPHKTPSAPGLCFLYKHMLSFHKKQFCFRQSCRTSGFGHVFLLFRPSSRLFPALCGGPFSAFCSCINIITGLYILPYQRQMGRGCGPELLCQIFSVRKSVTICLPERPPWSEQNFPYF